MFTRHVLNMAPKLALAPALLATAILSTVSVSQAQTLEQNQATLEEAYVHEFSNVRQKLSSIPMQNSFAVNPNIAPSCRQFYDRMDHDGVLDIRMAFGYMDVSVGEPYVLAGFDLGQSPALDSGAAPAMRRVLTSSCRRVNALSCGFSQRSDDPEVLEKEITRADGRRVIARVRLTQGAASVSHEVNQGPWRATQAALTSAGERNFFGGLREADAVIYIGHARSGGGPDFSPVVLVRDNNPNTYDKPNYAGYYKKVRPGLNRMLQALRGAPRQPSMIALLACSSEPHFARAVRQAAPHSTLITTTDLAYYDMLVESGLGTVESLLRGSCGEEMRANVQLRAASRREVIIR